MLQEVKEKCCKPKYLVLACLILSCHVWLLWLIPTHVDIAWFSDATARWLDGEILYKEVVDMNLPMIFFINVPSAIIAKTLQVPILFGYKLFTSILSGIICIYIALLFKRSTLSNSQIKTLSIVMVSSFFILFARQLGQREYWAIILTLPFIVSHIPNIYKKITRNERILIGILLSIGVSIKVTFLLLTIIFFIAFPKVRQHLYATYLISTAFILTSVAGIFLFFPHYTNILQISLDTYGRYHTPHLILIILLSLLPLTSIFLYLGTPSKSHMKPLMLSTLAFTLSALTQNKGWMEHFFPANILAMLTLTAFYFDQNNTPTNLIKATAIMPIVFLAALQVTDARIYLLFHREHPRFVETKAFLDTHAEGESVYVFTTNMDGVYQIIHESKAKSASRFNAFWMLPGIILDADYHSQEVKQYLFAAVAEDIEKNRPKYIFFDTQPQAKLNNVYFNFMEYFNQDGAFHKLIENYAFTSNQYGFSIYQHL